MIKAEERIDSIEKWLEKHVRFSDRIFRSGRRVDETQFHSSPLFSRDKHAIELPNRKQIFDEEAPTEVQAYEKAGITHAAISWDSSGATKSKGDLFRFLNDWEKLWDFLAMEDSDEIAEHLPLYRIAIELIFHPRVAQLMQLMYVWNLVVFALLASRYPQLPISVVDFNIVTYTLEVVVYMILFALHRGRGLIGSVRLHLLTLPCRLCARADPTASGRSASVAEDGSADISGSVETAQEAIDQDFTLLATLRRCWRRLRNETLQLGGSAAQASTRNRKAVARQSLSYYRWMNVGMKLLTRDYGIDLRELRFNRRSYRLLMVSVLGIYPIYATALSYSQGIMATAVACGGSLTGNGANDDVTSKSLCSFFQLQMLCTIFGVTAVASLVIFGLSVLVSLCGLVYGCEIAFRLAECWIERYHSLRRLSISPDRAGFKHIADEEAINDNEADVDHSTVGRKLTMTLPMDGAALIACVSRDAVEHYLCISALLRKAGDMWSPILTLFVFLALYLCLGNAIFVGQAIADGLLANPLYTFTLLRLLVFTSIRLFVVAVAPVLSIAFANSHFQKLFDVFQNAEERDYALIGGRDSWLRRFRETPASWAFFGVAITPERLTALLWTLLATLGGVLITTALSSSSI